MKHTNSQARATKNVATVAKQQSIKKEQSPTKEK